MKKTTTLFLGLVAAMIAVAIFSGGAVAQETVVTVDEPGFNWFEALLSVLGIALTAILGWGASILKAKTGIDIEKRYRDAIHEALLNGVRKFLVGQGWIPGTPVPVERAAAAAVQYVKATNPDAVKHFELSDATLNTLAMTKMPTVNPEVGPNAVSRPSDGPLPRTPA